MKNGDVMAINQKLIYRQAQIIRFYGLIYLMTFTFDEQHLNLWSGKYDSIPTKGLIKRLAEQLSLIYGIKFVIRYEESGKKNRPHFHACGNKYIPHSLLSKKWDQGFVHIKKIHHQAEYYMTKLGNRIYEVHTAEYLGKRIELNNPEEFGVSIVDLLTYM